MRTRPRHLLPAAAAAALALVITSCGGGGGGGDGGLAGTDQQQGVNDINPQPRDQVRDGGDLRWPLDAIPDNFNPNQVDGNLKENVEVMGALLPSAFLAEADATVTVDENYFTSVELTSEDPQVVTYTINPEATWDDGTPITFEDLRAQWSALNGTNPAYLPAGTTGYEDIASVEAGEDEKQAVVTFARPFAEWQALFGSLLPRATNSNPQLFNESCIERPGTTAGPFRVENVDQTAQTITLVRNDKWWGEPAKLDRIIYRVTDRAALADALANNEIDFYSIGSDVNLFQRARGIQGVQIRQATEPLFNHITFNGGEGAILSDPALRRALAQGINRQAVASALIGQIVPDTTPLGNFIYVQGSADYVDHSQGVAYNPQAAMAALDQLGWVSPGPGQVRSKDGRPLNIRVVTTAGNPISERISQLVQAQLTEVGAGIELIPAASADLFDEFVTPGNFDTVGFAYSGSTFPISGSRDIYVTDGESNVSNTSNPMIDELFARATAELDPQARTALGQQIDELLWEELPLLPMYQSTGAYAVRATVANFGAPGFASYDYINMGFTG
jgi:peptide/nickel transport system substrate-binding protein